MTLPRVKSLLERWDEESPPVAPPRPPEHPGDPEVKGEEAERTRAEEARQLRSAEPGDAHEGAARNGHAGNGAGRNRQAPPPRTWPAPIPAPDLKLADQSRKWLWQGYLSRGGVTLLSALWKAGKSTLLAHLLRAFQDGGLFCDLRVTPARVLFVTEESESRWAERRDDLSLEAHVDFLIRPFRAAKADWRGWLDFLDYLQQLQAARHYDLLVMDTLTEIWPVDRENEAPVVQAALQPLRGLGDDLSCLLVHHLRKGDGQEATGSRGSGALTGFVDTILELRRFDPANRKDRRRVLTGYGRDDETYDEMVVELGERGYVAHGDRDQIAGRQIRETLLEVLPKEPPGMTWTQIRDAWPGEHAPRTQRLLDALDEGIGPGDWHRLGGGKKGSPYTYFRGPDALPPPIGGETETDAGTMPPDPFADV